MDEMRERLRALPKIDEILSRRDVAESCSEYGRSIVVDAARAVTEKMRREILTGSTPDISMEAAARATKAEARREATPSLRRVINATGVVLHTNLGRAVMSVAAAEAAAEVACRYNTLEYDVEHGERGSRYTHVERLLTKICGTEAAMVVNNNAAAVILVLSTMVRGKEAVVSRGELVEIGGAFRVPDIMEQSGGILREVGTTNKTHAFDYENAINENTGALLKVHTSNFKILGFTEEVSLEQLCAIGAARGVPVIYDLGSGALVPLEKYGIHDEPNVIDAVKTGAEVVSFSGDKLLGGPQAGIIVGKKQYIDAMKKNPLTRALRIDKLTLAALEATLRSYADPRRAEEEIPTLRMLAQSRLALRERAQKLNDILKFSGVNGMIVEEFGQVGGGSVPTQMIKTIAYALDTDKLPPDEIGTRLRAYDIPIVARISKDRVLFDMRTVQDDEVDYIADALANILTEA
ncbi:MAG: L-seryl-tRNA(Sec) selenium transferase [Clostridia bacterium]|nr:L-seryl-tRNA(Sec) selenium transferase [Clostridia bacterium]